MSDWYDGIEPEIREYVRLLRNNGFNTISSCGHEMWIVIENNDGDTAERLDWFLYDHFAGTVTPCTWHISEDIWRERGRAYSHTIRLELGRTESVTE